jgi:hypothetical protein
MPFTDLIPSRNLQIFSYEDIDHFRHGFRDTNVDIVPLANFNGDLGQAVLTLPGCTVYLLRTFPRIVRSAIGGAGTFFLFSLRDAPAVIFNGKEAPPSSLHSRAVPRSTGRSSGNPATTLRSRSPRGWKAGVGRKPMASS